MRFAFATFLLVAALGLAGTAAAAPGGGHGSGRVVFALTDNTAGNQVVAYDRVGDGRLKPAGSYSTGGVGGVLTGSVVDHTASQGALTYDEADGLLLAVNAALLAVVLVVTTFAARKLRFSTEDAIAIVFCGSKKSLASGLPMAIVLFPAATVGLAVLPLMLFHQMQLMVCAWRR